jgi:hypothetical protein
MITDKLLRVSTDQVVTLTDTSALSTDTIDLSVARDIGEGEELYMNFAMTTAAAGGTSTQFEVIIADDAALTSNVTVVGSSGAIATANLTLGKNIAVRIDPLVGSLGKRYMGARYTVVGTNSAGKVTADIVNTIQDGKKFYASGFTVV